MTKKELNAAVKKLSSEIYSRSFGDTAEYDAYIYNVATPEFKRLHNADDTLNSLTKESLLRMIRMNNAHRFIPFHSFGININLY